VTAAPEVICLGILVADVIASPIGELPLRGTLGFVDGVALRGGGCALNTATALARLGVASGVAGKIGADPFGEFVLGLLDQRGVDRRGVVVDPVVSTSATVVLVDAAGERTFLHFPGANGRVRSNDLDRRFLFAGRALHLGGALVMPELDGPPTAALLAEARLRGLHTSLDPVWDPYARWERLVPALPHLDLFTPSLAEGRAISGELAPADVAAWLRERGVGTVALKTGAEGCFVSGPSFEAQVEAFPVRVVDGTGAGDAFAAGLLYGALKGWPLPRSARLANALGALATTTVGATEGLLGLRETLAFAGLG